jgi:hypothetical protein
VVVVFGIVVVVVDLRVLETSGTVVGSDWAPDAFCELETTA